MKFSDLDEKMRKFETIWDTRLVSDVYMVVRVDGRGFTNLTKDLNFKKPYDSQFSSTMVNTAKSLMNSGFKCIYGYTQSDEISILISPDDTTFNRKLRKINSIMAGTASAAFTHDIGEIGVFDARTFILPSSDLVIDYFRWRAQDAYRNSLNSYCYWTLRDYGDSGRQATKHLLEMSKENKHILLMSHGIDFKEIPEWQKNGTGMYYTEYKKDGYNPITNEKIVTDRRELTVTSELPYGDTYSKFMKGILE